MSRFKQSVFTSAALFVGMYAFMGIAVLTPSRLGPDHVGAKFAVVIMMIMAICLILSLGVLVAVALTGSRQAPTSGASERPVPSLRLPKNRKEWTQIVLVGSACLLVSMLASHFL